MLPEILFAIREGKKGLTKVKCCFKGCCSAHADVESVGVSPTEDFRDLSKPRLKKGQ